MLARSSCLLLIALAAGLILPATAAGDQAVLSLYEARSDKLILQQFDLSCGAAALATILRYQHGENVNEHQVALELIRREAYLSNPELVRIRQGFSLLDMKRYAARSGYRGEAFGDVTLDELRRLRPAIVPIRLHGYNHFVVFRGILGGNVLLGDPAFGNRTLPLHRFATAWIDFSELGRVAFSVSRRDGLIPPNQLTAKPADFPVLLPVAMGNSR